MNEKEPTTCDMCNHLLSDHELQERNEVMKVLRCKKCKCQQLVIVQNVLGAMQRK